MLHTGLRRSLGDRRGGIQRFDENDLRPSREGMDDVVGV
jgi:hypothetical protein